MLTTAATGGASVVKVISESRTVLSRTLTARPATPRSNSSSPTAPRIRSHDCSSGRGDEGVRVGRDPTEQTQQQVPLVLAHAVEGTRLGCVTSGRERGE